VTARLKKKKKKKQAGTELCQAQAQLYLPAETELIQVEINV
jgi:hypothetical protein